jgi:hypothetical protein
MPDPGQLYIRWSETGLDDNRTDPGGATWYLSKSVGIYNPANPLQDPGLAITGAAQKIRVNVDTLLTKTNVGVQAWVCAYGTAGQPFLPSALGKKGLLKDLDDQVPPQPLTATAGPQLTVDLPWTPSPNDLTSLGLNATDDLHVCLLANCYATPPGAVPDGQQIVAQPPPIDVPNNRHHAQHNITLHGVASLSGGMGMDMFAGNPAGEGEEVFELEVASHHRERLEPQLLKLARNSRWGPALAASGGPHLGKEPVEDLHLAIGGERGPKVRVPLTADKPQRLTLGFEFGGDEDNVLRAFDIVQRRSRDRRIVGGARLVTLAVADDVFKEVTAAATATA